MKRMRAVVAGLTVMAGGYIASPYVVLYQLGSALRGGDIAALRTEVDWDGVRRGVKIDVGESMDAVATVPATPVMATAKLQMASVSDDLPPFGASFASGLADTAIDRQVTPDHLVAALQAGVQSGARTGGSAIVQSAYFTGAESFEVRLRLPTETQADPPVRLRLTLVGLHWKVSRVWVPADLLTGSYAHMS